MKIIYLIFLLCAMASCAGNDGRQSMGEARYSEGFLWTDADTVYAEKILETNFSKGAELHNDRVTLMFKVGRETGGKIVSVPMKDVVVRFDGQRVGQSGKVEINAKDKTEHKLQICVPGSEDGTYTLDINADGNAMDMVMYNGAELGSGKMIALSFDNVEKMNDLKCWLMWVGIVAVTGLVLWLLIIKKIVYPLFGNVQKTIMIPNQSPVFLRLKGCREAVVSNTKGKQGWFDRIFRGKIAYYTSPAITSPITFKPRKNGIMVKVNSMDYSVNPNPVPLLGQGMIKDNKTKVVMNIR